MLSSWTGNIYWCVQIFTFHFYFFSALANQFMLQKENMIMWLISMRKCPDVWRLNLKERSFTYCRLKTKGALFPRAWRSQVICFTTLLSYVGCMCYVFIALFLLNDTKRIFCSSPLRGGREPGCAIGDARKWRWILQSILPESVHQANNATWKWLHSRILSVE